MNKFIPKMIIIITTMFCVSCTSLVSIQNSYELDENITESIDTQHNNQYKYIINKSSGKVHSYTHGNKIITNRDNIQQTNDNIENILKNHNYDICRTCWAGLKVNLKDYKNEDFNLIEKFMRLYDFGFCDEEEQKFLMCIFEVGEWYVDNVYTYQGGDSTVSDVEFNAKNSASNTAYERWQNYQKSYSASYAIENNKKILPVVYDDKNRPTTLVTYVCELFKNLRYGLGDNKYSKSGRQILKNSSGEEVAREWKNYCVVDDCSKFAAAVYYHYINKEILSKKIMADKIGYGIDLWGTNSTMFSNINNFTNKILSTGKFDLIKWNILKTKNLGNRTEAYYKDIKFDLKIGDLLYRKDHVEFYIGNGKVVGWGRVHNTCTLSKEFHIEEDGFHSNDSEDKNLPYVAIIRFKGGR